MRIKVVENTRDQLIVRMVPTAAPVLFLGGLLFFLLGPLTVWLLGYTTELKVNSDELSFKRAFLTRYDADEWSIPVDAIREIDTQVYASMGKTLDITIHTNSRGLRVPFDNLDGDAKRALATRLKAAIASGNNFSESSGSGLPTIGVILGAALTCAGLCCLYFLQTSTVIGSKEEQWLGVRISRWLFPLSRESRIELSDFLTVNHKAFSITTDAPSASSNSVFVATKTGKTLPLASGPMFTEKSTEEIEMIVESWVRAANRPARKR